MNKKFNESNLTPNVRTIALIGGTGDGKTETTNIIAAQKAKNIISKGIGEASSTLKEKKLVYSESVKDEIILAVKLKEEILDGEDFKNVISVVVAKIIKDYGKSISVNQNKLKDDFISYMELEVNTKVNSRATLSFLDDQQKEDLIVELADIFSWENFFERYSYEIYNKVKNDLKDLEVKENSAKFFSAIKGEAEIAIDIINKERIWDILYSVNNKLKEVFFKYFHGNSKSLDGYYYHIINLDKQNESEEIIDAMFTSNNLRKGEELSIEIFCKEIVIYVPMHEMILKLIKSNDKYNKVFMGKDGTVSIAFYDTKGLYHDNSTDEGNLEYFNKLLYNINYDALMLVAPLFGDSNEAKLRELYTKAMRQYNKQVPIFILNNKVDLLIDSLYKELSSDDPLTFYTSDKELNPEDIRSNVNKRMESIRIELQSVQHKNRKNIDMISLPCYLKKDNRMSPEMLEEYNVMNAIKIIIEEMAEHLEPSSEKIYFSLLDNDVSDIQIKINDNKLSDIINKLISKKETELKILKPSVEDITKNIGKTPHGNGYNALLDRLQDGYGYTSNIDESYFHNCHSFSINFPAMLRNLITRELITEFLNEVVSFSGGTFRYPNGEQRLKEITKDFGYFNIQKFVAEMVYYKAIVKAQKTNFSYGARFSDFLNHSLSYFSGNNIDVSPYNDSIIKTLTEALNKVIDFHILYV